MGAMPARASRASSHSVWQRRITPCSTIPNGFWGYSSIGRSVPDIQNSVPSIMGGCGGWRADVHYQTNICKYRAQSAAYRSTHIKYQPINLLKILLVHVLCPTRSVMQWMARPPLEINMCKQASKTSHLWL